MSDVKKETLQRTSAMLEAKRDQTLNAFIGVDGFVDEIVHVVRKRHDAHRFDRVETIAEYGERILRAAGLSTNIEYVSVQTKLGGNGPIFSNALMEYGVHTTYAGNLGKPDIHPVFRPMAERATVYSLANPGFTDAVEFYDGKLIIGKHQTLKEVNWKNFRTALGGPEQIAHMIGRCQLFGMENWTMMPYMGEIWAGLMEEVFPLLPDPPVKPIAFFDLADPEKRSADDIRAAMGQIGQFEQKFRAILGLNEKEAYDIAKLYDILPDESLPEVERLETVVFALYQKLNIHCLVVHPIRYAVACTVDGLFRSFGPYCEKPVLTTGAGDNFNAGFCYAYALGLDPEAALVAGNATSGFYVRRAKSPQLDDLLDFLDHWQRGTLSS